VVVDANQLGVKGHLKLQKLRFLASALALEQRELWIPEPVLWEWAEHAAAAVGQLGAEAKAGLELTGIANRTDLSRANNELAKMAMQTISAIPNVRILYPSDAAYKAALRDQTLSVGAGKRLNGVKKGGADTASVHAIRQYCADAAAYVAFTGDADWAEVYAWYEWDAPMFIKDQPKLFVAHPIDVGARHEALLKLVDDAFDLGPALAGDDAAGWLAESYYPQVMASELLLDVGIRKLTDFEGDETEQILWANIEFEGVAEGIISIWDPVDGQWTTTSTGFYDIEGNVPVMFTLDQDRKAIETWSVDRSDMVLIDQGTGKPLSMDW
jgi:hypothetical protein